MEMLSRQIGSCLLGMLMTSNVIASDISSNPRSLIPIQVIADAQNNTVPQMPIIATSDSILSESQLLTPEEVAEQQKLTELNKRAYTLTYTSKTKGPALENVTVKGQVFQGGKPISYFEVKTNEEGKFAFDKDYGKNAAIDLFHISGQEKMKVNCQGSAVPGSQELKISCTPKKLGYSQ
ncbi:MAG: hypothetical protein U1E78_02505 [Gammaproteobacteria bacterium]